MKRGDIPSFEIELGELGEHAYAVSVRGELDLHSAPALERELSGLLADPPRYVVVDLLDVQFIDSTALGMLVQGDRSLRDAGGELALVLPQGETANAFRVTGLDRHFRTFTSLADSLAYFHDSVAPNGFPVQA